MPKQKIHKLPDLSQDQQMIIAGMGNLGSVFKDTCRNKFDAPRRANYLVMKSAGMTDFTCAALLGVNDRTIRTYKAKHPEFATAVLDAPKVLTDIARYHQQARVVAGVEKAIELELKAKAPEYAPKQDVNVNHIHNLNDKQLDARLNALLNNSRLLEHAADNDAVDAEFTEVKQAQVTDNTGDTA